MGHRNSLSSLILLHPLQTLYKFCSHIIILTVLLRFLSQVPLCLNQQLLHPLQPLVRLKTENNRFVLLHNEPLTFGGKQQTNLSLITIKTNLSFYLSPYGLSLWMGILWFIMLQV